MLFGRDPVEHQPSRDQGDSRERKPQAIRRGAVRTPSFSSSRAIRATVLAPNSSHSSERLRLPDGAHGIRARDRVGHRAKAGLRRGRAARRVPVHPRAVSGHVPRPALDDPPVRGLRVRRGDERALPLPARAGPDGSLGRVRPARPSSATTRTIRTRSARSAARGSRSTRSRTCGSSSTRSRSARSRPR